MSDLRTPKLLGRTYSPDRPIQIELVLHDDSGVGTVTAVFEKVDDPIIAIQLRADLHGERDPKLILEKEVTDEVAPGEYRCRYILAQDVHGYAREYTPDMRFWVENVPGDYEPPELKGWRPL